MPCLVTRAIRLGACREYDTAVTPLRRLGRTYLDQQFQNCLEEGDPFCCAKNIPLKMRNSVKRMRKAIAIETAEEQNITCLLNAKRVVSHLDCPLLSELGKHSWCGPHGLHQHRMEEENNLEGKI